MVGQNETLKKVDSWIENNTIPRFLIIYGEEKSGKATLAREISKKMNAAFVPCELSVDSVRKVVENCYKCSGRTVYFFPNADKMSGNAKGALLKITEEPPRDAHFILSVQDANSFSETLKSRAVLIKILPYTKEELDGYFANFTDAPQQVREVSSSPGMMKELVSSNIGELLVFCEKVVDNVQLVTGVNALKIAQRIRTKEGKEGYDGNQFFNCIEWVLSRRVVSRDCEENLSMWSRMLKETCKYHREFNRSGIKKDSTLDMWILALREC